MSRRFDFLTSALFWPAHYSFRQSCHRSRRRRPLTAIARRTITACFCQDSSPARCRSRNPFSAARLTSGVRVSGWLALRVMPVIWHPTGRTEACVKRECLFLFFERLCCAENCRDFIRIKGTGISDRSAHSLSAGVPCWRRARYRLCASRTRLSLENCCVRPPAPDTAANCGHRGKVSFQ